MAIRYTCIQTFLGFYAPSSQIQVKDWKYSFITREILKKINNCQTNYS